MINICTTRNLATTIAIVSIVILGHWRKVKLIVLPPRLLLHLEQLSRSRACSPLRLKMDLRLIYVHHAEEER